MSGHRPWSEIRSKIRSDPERRPRIEQLEQAIAAELTISQLREARGATQESVAVSGHQNIGDEETVAFVARQLRELLLTYLTPW